MDNLCKLEKIEQLFLHYDFMKLISNWSNHDEYNGIALSFALSLNFHDSVSSIQQKTWDVFYNYFCISSYRKNGTPGYIKLSREKACEKIGTVDKFLDFAIKVKEILDE